MEHMSESLMRSAFTISTPDPYMAAHELLHWAARFGRVVERENRLLTTGPRTVADVKFYIERELDKFTHMHIIFDLSANITTTTLAASIEATLECSLPTPRGFATTVFRDTYLARMFPAHLRLAQDLAKDIVSAARLQLPAAKSDRG
jgi:hypothetical protein